jgi:nucleotide-binding universal stress UspA family protein
MEPFKIKKILMPTDFSETAGNALKQAISVAKIAKAELKLLHVIYPEMNYDTSVPIPRSNAYYDSIKKSIETKLKEIALQIKKESAIEVSYVVKLGIEHRQICETAEEENIDVIIMGTHGVSGVMEFFAGSNASKVVAHASCPVITIQKTPKSKGFKNILLPIRSEINSRQKVDYAAELAKLFSATIFITGFANKGNKSDLAKVKQYVKQVEKYLKTLDIKSESTIIVGDNFTKDILSQAKINKVDLIAIMNEHDFSLDQLLKGPFAKQFVNHSTIPVMSVPVYSNPDLISYSPFLSGVMPSSSF